MPLTACNKAQRTIEELMSLNILAITSAGLAALREKRERERKKKVIGSLERIMWKTIRMKTNKEYSECHIQESPIHVTKFRDLKPKP